MTVCCEGNMLQPIRRTTLIWVATRHQYRISLLVPLTSFRGETSGDVPGCFLRQTYSFLIICRILLPTSIQRHTVLKSPHIYKKHRAQYEIRTQARMLQVCVGYILNRNVGDCDLCFGNLCRR